MSYDNRSVLINRLDICDQENAVNLAVDCFVDDAYYISMFKGSSLRKELATMFSHAMMFCMLHGIAYKAEFNHEVIAFLIAFDYFHVKHNYYHEYRKIFGLDVGPDMPFMITPDLSPVLTRADALQTNTIYLLSMGVKESYRKRGIASMLIDAILYDYPNHNFIGDVSNKDSLEIYRSRCFHVEMGQQMLYTVILPITTKTK